MKHSKHTPGPWVIGKNGTAVTTKHGGYIATADTGTNVEIDESNARLIAAAPEMLEALKLVHSLHCGDIYDFKAPQTMHEIIERVVAAITKAIGGAE